MQVGVREFRANLSRWLDRIQTGEEVVITDRGVPIARLIAVSSTRPMERLIAAGLVKRPSAPRERLGTHTRVRARGSVSDLVGEQRR